MILIKTVKPNIDWAEYKEEEEKMKSNKQNSR